MGQVTYTSKKIGDIVIKSDANRYTMCSSRLEARSLNQDPEHCLIENYSRLLINPDNVRLFGDGKPLDSSAITDFIQTETKHWHEGNKFSVFSIYLANTQEFIGYLHIEHALDDFSHIGVGHQNVGEITYIIDQAFWGKGYGTEIAILGKKFIKQIISETADESPEKNMKEIVATVHPSNLGSKKILQKTLKHQEPEEFTKFGGQPRLLFFKPLDKVHKVLISTEPCPTEATIRN